MVRSGGDQAGVPIGRLGRRWREGLREARPGFLLASLSGGGAPDRAGPERDSYWLTRVGVERGGMPEFLLADSVAGAESVCGWLQAFGKKGNFIVDLF